LPALDRLFRSRTGASLKARSATNPCKKNCIPHWRRQWPCISSDDATSDLRMVMKPTGGNENRLGMTRRHSAFAEKLASLEQGLNKRNAGESSQAISRALREFEDFSLNDRERHLQAGLGQSDGSQAVCEWVSACYDHLARMAREVVPAEVPVVTPGDVKQHAQLAFAWALAIILAAHASKWRKIAGLRADTASRGRLHGLYVSGLAARVDACILEVSVDRRRIETTVEALYVRALLLERFASGNLPPRRLEILDSWLLEWMGALWLSRAPTLEGPWLAVDTRNPNLGLTRFHPGDKADFFLGLKPLQRQLERAAKDFHRGVIFPRWGIGLNFRMEEHVAVIEFLEREFDIIEHADAQKGKRFPIGRNSDVSVFFGFNDIYTQALQRQSTITPAGVTRAPGGLIEAVASKLNADASVAKGILGASGQPQQSIRLLDISESGLGLEMSAEAAAMVELDELIAVQIEAGRPWVLGVVVRKTGTQLNRVATVGIRVLSKLPMRAGLSLVHESQAQHAIKGIFVAGAAEHGFADSLIVADSVYRTSSTLSATVASGVFHLRLGRVRQQGPGWKMAAVEVIVAR
jgi:hypothetical protein